MTKSGEILDHLTMPVRNDIINEAGKRGSLAYIKMLAWQRILVGDTGAVEDESLRAIAKLHSERVRGEYKAEAVAGVHNNRQSRRAGLLAIVSSEARAEVERAYSVDHKAAKPAFKPDFEPWEAGTEDRDLFAMAMPLGGFTQLESGIQFDSVVEQNGVDSVRRVRFSTDFRLAGADMIVRIEGLYGDHWQNPALNIDGSFRQQQVA